MPDRQSVGGMDVHWEDVEADRNEEMPMELRLAVVHPELLAGGHARRNADLPQEHDDTARRPD